MEFVELTPDAEKVLQEIIENIDNSPIYWGDRFEGLTTKEDMQLRAIFKELKNKTYISLTWADNHPWIINVSSEGYQYFKLKADHIKEEKRITKREWMIAIISALLGGLVTLIPFLFQCH